MMEKSNEFYTDVFSAGNLKSYNRGNVKLGNYIIPNSWLIKDYKDNGLVKIFVRKLDNYELRNFVSVTSDDSKIFSYRHSIKDLQSDFSKIVKDFKNNDDEKIKEYLAEHEIEDIYFRKSINKVNEIFAKYDMKLVFSYNLEKECMFHVDLYKIDKETNLPLNFICSWNVYSLEDLAFEIRDYFADKLVGYNFTKKCKRIVQILLKDDTELSKKLAS